MEDINFNQLHIWIQVHGLSLDMYNPENAHRIDNIVGKCLMVEPAQAMQHRSFLRLKIEISTDDPLIVSFWWSNPQGHDKLTSIKYKRLSDICYGCGRLGHTSQYCEEKVAMSELKPEFPRYRPWLSGLKPRNNMLFQVEGEIKRTMDLEIPVEGVRGR